MECQHLPIEKLRFGMLVHVDGFGCDRAFVYIGFFRPPTPLAKKKDYHFAPLFRTTHENPYLPLRAGVPRERLLQKIHRPR